ncbi:MAG: hypothetical protein WBW75_28230 [Mycobacterium sp.]
MPAINGYWRKGMSRADAPYLTLTAEVIAKHLRGDLHIGLYPLGDDDTCWWVAADFDKNSAMLDALAYLKAARAYGIPAALEVSQSGRGAHVWIFFTQATSASAARRIATSLLGEAIQLRGSMSLTSYDRLFPSQDVHTGRGMGNLIAAPLNGTRRQHGTTLFLDPATLEPFDDQWAYLSSIARLSVNEVAALARKLPDPKIGHDVRRLQLPTSSKIVPRPAAIIRASLRGPIKTDRSRSGPSNDLGSQARGIDPEPGVPRPATGPPKHLGHAAISSQLRRNRRGRPHFAARVVVAVDNPRRIRREHDAYRRLPRHRD